MAKVRIKIIEAFDSSSRGFQGTTVVDMFKSLSTGVIESKNSEDILKEGVRMCEAYLILNPGASVMPTYHVIEGRKPKGFDNMSSSSNPENRKFLKQEPT